MQIVTFFTTVMNCLDDAVAGLGLIPRSEFNIVFSKLYPFIGDLTECIQIGNLISFFKIVNAIS